MLAFSVTVTLFCVTLAACSSEKEYDIPSLKSEMALAQQQLKEMTVRYSQETVKKFQEEEKMMRRISSVERKNTELEAEISSLKSQGISHGEARPFDSPVAFTAALSENFSGGDDMAVVPYDINRLNYGDAYDFQNNVFTAPVRGLYWFTVSVRAWNGGAAVALRVNGETLVGAIGQESYHADSVSAIVMLEAGQRADVVKPSALHELYDSTGIYNYNVFAGFLYAQL